MGETWDHSTSFNIKAVKYKGEKSVKNVLKSTEQKN